MEPQLIVVDSDVVPAIFLKVLKAKQLLSKGLAKNSTEACKIANISRSAYYKYRDSIFSYEEKNTEKTITLYLRLSDDQGVLSSVLATLCSHQANILTVNQNIPLDGAADVTITVRINQNQIALSALLQDLRILSGVVEVRRI